MGGFFACWPGRTLPAPIHLSLKGSLNSAGSQDYNIKGGKPRGLPPLPVIFS